MKLEDQVCSIEQAKRLKELGVLQESLFYHCPWKATDWQGVFIGAKCNKGMFHSLDGEVETFSTPPEIFSAFTAAELMTALPDRPSDKKRCGCEMTISQGPYNGGRYQLCTIGSGNYHAHGIFKTWALAAAELLLYQIEVCKLPTSDINERLKNAD